MIMKIKTSIGNKTVYYTQATKLKQDLHINVKILNNKRMTEKMKTK